MLNSRKKRSNSKTIATLSFCLFASFTFSLRGSASESVDSEDALSLLNAFEILLIDDDTLTYRSKNQTRLTITNLTCKGVQQMGQCAQVICQSDQMDLHNIQKDVISKNSVLINDILKKYETLIEQQDGVIIRSVQKVSCIKYHERVAHVDCELFL